MCQLWVSPKVEVKTELKVQEIYCGKHLRTMKKRSESNQAEPLDHNAVWPWKRREGRKELCMKIVLTRLMGNPQNKALHLRRPVLSRNCPSLSFPLSSVVGWEQSRLRQFYQNCSIGSWKYGSYRWSGNNSPHTRFSLGGRSKWSAAMAVIGKFQPHNCFNSSSWLKFQENPNPNILNSVPFHKLS